MKEPKVRVRPSVLIAGDWDGEGALVAVRDVMPTRLALRGFRAASPRRRPVSRRFVLLFYGFTPDIVIEDVPLPRGTHFPDFFAIDYPV